MVSQLPCAAPFVHDDNQSVDVIVNDVFSNGKGVVFIINNENALCGGVFKSQILLACRTGRALILSELISPVNIVGTTQQSDTDIQQLFSASVQLVPVLENKKLVSLAVPTPPARADKVNLNIGSGGYYLPGFTNLDYPSDWYQGQQQQPFIAYDMRSDDLPFSNGSVDNIYCSHVIEHIETPYVTHFFQEAARVLKPGGVLRVACPDADFLKQVSAFDNHFWDFRKPWFNTHTPGHESVTQPDYLVREIATRQSRFLSTMASQPRLTEEQISTQSTQTLVNTLCAELSFDAERPGDHINGWWFERIAAVCSSLPFSHCIRSKFGGSVSAAMQGADIDQTYPNMSLYVDLVR